MSKQREVLPEVLATIIAQAPDAAIYLSGSVALGKERPDSDLDVYAVVKDLEDFSYPGGTLENEDVTEGFRSFTGEHNGVCLEIRFLTESFFERHLVNKPWRGYKVPLKSEILSDPHGFLQSWRDRVSPWFHEHPEAVALWEQWIWFDKTKVSDGSANLLLLDFVKKTDLEAVRRDPEQWVREYTSIIHEVGLGEAIMAANMFDVDYISKSILEHKALKNVREIAIEAGYRGKELDAVVTMIDKNLETLDRDVDEILKAITGT